MKGKPHKWGFKFFVRAGASGFVYDFFPYQGKTTDEISSVITNEENTTCLGVGGAVVVKLSQTIKYPENSVVYFDNFFSSIYLFRFLKENMNLLSLGTMRSNRLGGCPLIDDKTLLKSGRGSVDYKSYQNELILLKWADNKCVIIGSTACGIEPQGIVKRYNKDLKKKSNIPAPAVVLQYNQHMGGVDKSNGLVGLYRTPSKSRRWYFPIFGYILDVCVVNSWLLYRYHCSVNKIKPTNLKKFRLEIATALSTTGKPKRGRPSDHTPQNKIKEPILQRPNVLTRCDGLEHWPIHTSKGRCRFCQKGTSRMKCLKCDCRLCFTSEKNCFYDFHKK